MVSADPSSHLQEDSCVGRWLKDKWHLDEVLGSGGIGTVYAATHRNRSRAAIKVLHPELASRRSLVDRFLLEGYAANAVGHPGAVQVIDDDTTDDGLVFLVMQLLEGETLDRRAHSCGGRLPLVEALNAIEQVLAVIEVAHAKGIVHRDLKPENIFVCGDGAYKVLDFGLARVLELTASPRTRTQQGWMMGTPGYMPPEQIRGLWDRVDTRSDVWAVGASLFSLISGRLVHQTDDGEVDIFATATSPAPSLATVAPKAPADVIAVVDRALQMRPEDRWASAAALREAIFSLGAMNEPRSSSIPARSMRPSGPARRIRAADNKSAIEIAPDTYWVGKRDPKGIFHSNPYLRVFHGAGMGNSDPYNLLIDPGSSSDFSVVSAKVGALIGGLSALSGLFINHQDPDVGSAASLICGRYAPNAVIHCSEATWRLIVHMNLPTERFANTDSHVHGLVLPTGHKVLPVPSPFCHFRGAVMLYDPETRVLFTGDLLGGITAPGTQGIWADESDWSGVRAFHQAYMPTNRALAAAARAIRKLNPFPDIIAPQHGRLLQGPLLMRFLERLERLPVGLDIMDDVGDGPDARAAWSSVLNRVLHTARIVLGEGPEHIIAESEEVRDCCTLQEGRFEVISAGRWTISTVVRLLTAGRSPTLANPIRLEAILACEELELPSPDVLLAADANGVSVV